MSGYLKTSLLLAVMTALFMGVGYATGGLSGMLISFVLAVGVNFWAWWKSDAMVLRLHQAKPLQFEDAPTLFQMVEELADRAEIPMPALYLLQEQQPNAFATGRSPNHAAVAVTAGLLEYLSMDEIRGVVAHELAHIRHRDTLVMTITACFAGAIGSLTQIGILGRGRHQNPIVGLLVMILAPLAALLVQMAVSRSREYEADRLGAQIAGGPQGLANALQRLEVYRHQILNTQAERYPTTAHVFIINPLSGQGMDNLFSTHPSTENRIQALMNLR